MSHREPGRPVIAQHPGQEVAVLEAVVGPAEERDLPAEVSPRGIGDRLSGARLVEEQRIRHVSPAVRQQRPGVEFAELVPTDHIEAMDVPELPAQRQQRLQRHGRVVGIRLARQPAKRGSHWVGLREVDVPLAVGAVHSHIHLRRETRQQIQLGRRVAEGAGRGADIGPRRQRTAGGGSRA